MSQSKSCRRFLTVVALAFISLSGMTVSGCAERADIEWANYRKDPSLQQPRPVRFQGFGSGAYGSGAYGSGAYGSGMSYGSGAYGSGMPYGSGQFAPGRYGSGFSPAAYGSGNLPAGMPYGSGN